jgi:mono/diheme cytochrome c family protein/peroxiredoxin
VSAERLQHVRRPAPRHMVAIAGLTVAAAVGLGWAAGKLLSNREETAAPALQVSAKRGELLFQVHCASCHGPEGHGDGQAALTLRPPPRDFAARPWRSGVTRDSIRKVTLDGVPGTAMPASRSTLAAVDVEALVEHVYHLATAQPRTREPTAEERLLQEAGFVDLRGTDPPILTVTAADGRILKLTDQKGKLVLVSFWGSSCVHCLNEMPHLCDLEAAWGGRGLSVLHVCAEADDVQAAQDLASKVAPGVRIFVDDTGVSLARFEVQTLPTVWLIDRDGKAIGRAHGARDWRSPALRRLIEHWLAAS